MRVAHKSVRPLPSSQIAVTSCHDYLNQLLMVGVDKYIIVSTKFQTNHYKHLGSEFLSCFQKQQVDSAEMPTSTQET